MKEIMERCFAFLLIGLLLIKISAFHVYQHHDSIEDSENHCEVCVLAINGQQSEVFLTPLFTLLEFSFPTFVEQKINFSGFVLAKTNILVVLFSRPPPTLTV